ncbi:hypothetical protein MKW98_031913, partial [Papaver atlanticum]
RFICIYTRPLRFAKQKSESGEKKRNQKPLNINTPFEVSFRVNPRKLFLSSTGVFLWKRILMLAVFLWKRIHTWVHLNFPGGLVTTEILLTITDKAAKSSKMKRSWLHLFSMSLKEFASLYFYMHDPPSEESEEEDSIFALVSIQIVDEDGIGNVKSLCIDKVLEFTSEKPYQKLENCFELEKFEAGRFMVNERETGVLVLCIDTYILRSFLIECYGDHLTHELKSACMECLLNYETALEVWRSQDESEKKVLRTLIKPFSKLAMYRQMQCIFPDATCAFYPLLVEVLRYGALDGVELDRSKRNAHVRSLQLDELITYSVDDDEHSLVYPFETSMLGDRTNIYREWLQNPSISITGVQDPDGERPFCNQLLALGWCTVQLLPLANYSCAEKLKTVTTSKSQKKKRNKAKAKIKVGTGMVQLDVSQNPFVSPIQPVSLLQPVSLIQPVHRQLPIMPQQQQNGMAPWIKPPNMLVDKISRIDTDGSYVQKVKQIDLLNNNIGQSFQHRHAEEVQLDIAASFDKLYQVTKVTRRLKS